MIRRPPRSTLFPYTTSSDLVGARSLGACLPDRGSRARRHDRPDAVGDPAEEWIRERRGAGALGPRHPRSRRPERGPGDGAVASGWDLRPPDPPAYPRGGGDPAPSVRGTQEGHRADVQLPDEPRLAARLLRRLAGSARSGRRVRPPPRRRQPGRVLAVPGLPCDAPGAGGGPAARHTGRAGGGPVQFRVRAVLLGRSEPQPTPGRGAADPRGRPRVGVSSPGATLRRGAGPAPLRTIALGTTHALPLHARPRLATARLAGVRSPRRPDSRGIPRPRCRDDARRVQRDRKSTRLNSSH